LGQMSCNPSIGEWARGTSCAKWMFLDGLMARAADHAAIHRRRSTEAKACRLGTSGPGGSPTVQRAVRGAIGDLPNDVIPTEATAYCSSAELLRACGRSEAIFGLEPSSWASGTFLVPACSWARKWLLEAALRSRHLFPWQPNPRDRSCAIATEDGHSAAPGWTDYRLGSAEEQPSDGEHWTLCSPQRWLTAAAPLRNHPDQ
jgi:tRNA uridine 5-carboxymethylaminomethyl modification enzyme